MERGQDQLSSVLMLSATQQHHVRFANHGFQQFVDIARGCQLLPHIVSKDILNSFGIIHHN